MVESRYQIEVVLANRRTHSIPITQHEFLIGRSKEQAHIAIPTSEIQPVHLRVKYETEDIFTISNLQNDRDTYLEAQLLSPNQLTKWEVGQTVHVGATRLILQTLPKMPIKHSNSISELLKYGVPLIVLTVLFAVYLRSSSPFTFNTLLHLITLVLTLTLCGNSVFTLASMWYSWNKLDDEAQRQTPKFSRPPQYSFTALIPARHEDKVIQDTIRAVNRIAYPEHLKQTLILCRQDDVRTIAKVREVISELGKDNIRLVIFDGYPINKPHSLNQGLIHARNEIVGVFDAEDEPHEKIYQLINTVMIEKNADVVQAAVQLMNYRAPWFSVLNVLEYFFWFRSGLRFFSEVGHVTPLGGNTVFFKKEYLEQLGGWDETCLTEDADIGIKLSRIGAKIHIIYDERYATREETPDSTQSFIRQRARWSQGFLQIFLRGEWCQLPQLRQRLMAGYILLTPIFQALLVVSLPFGIGIALTTALPLGIALMSFTPLFLIGLQFLTQMYGLFEFTRAYKLRLPLWLPLMLAVVYYPYQIMLAVAACRAIYRLAVRQNNWEKTLHTNAHRTYQVETGLT